MFRGQTFMNHIKKSPEKYLARAKLLQSKFTGCRPSWLAVSNNDASLEIFQNCNFQKTSGVIWSIRWVLETSDKTKKPFTVDFVFGTAYNLP